MANISLPPSKLLHTNSKLYIGHGNTRLKKTKGYLRNQCFLNFKLSGTYSFVRLVNVCQATSIGVWPNNRSCFHKIKNKLKHKVADEESEKINTLVMQIKDKLRSMNEGEINPSAYDTAWVARIPSNDDPTKLQFPTTLEWILKNQNEDGSWGESGFFLLYDRLICTLSCVLTLTIWSTGNDHIAKGLKFLQAHTRQLQNESRTLMLAEFEMVFPSMLNEAKSLGIDLPYDFPCVKEIAALREKKISRIPTDMMHSVPTRMLYSLEALQEIVDWRKILKLQSIDGSFLTSPSSTAVVYMKTGDSKCLEYLTNIVNGYGDYSMFFQ